MKKIILLLIVLLTTSCTNNDINNLAIINEIAIDYNGIYKVYMKVLESDEKYEIYKEEGTTIDECFSNLNNKINKKIYLTHLEVLALSNTLSEKNYSEIFNFFMKQESSRNSFDTIIVDKIDKNLFDFETKDIENLLRLSITTTGLVNQKTLDEIIKDILNFNISYIPYIDLTNKEVKGYKSIYEVNKLMTKEESIAINFIFNKIDSIALLIDNKNYKLENCNTINDVKDNTIKINISCNMEGEEKNKEIVKSYLEEITNDYINNNNKNYFNYLGNKFNVKNYKIKPSIKIELIKTDTGDYFE